MTATLTKFKDIYNNYVPAKRTVVQRIPTSSTPPPEGGDIGDTVYVQPLGLLYTFTGYTPSGGYQWFLNQSSTAPVSPGKPVFSAKGVTYPAAGQPALSQFTNITSVSSVAYSAAADPGYSASYVPSSSTTTIDGQILCEMSFLGYVSGSTQTLLDNVGINIFSQTNQLLNSMTLQLIGLPSACQQFSLPFSVASAAYAGSGLTIKLNVWFNNTNVTSGMGCCLNGTINSTTNVCVSNPQQYMAAYFAEFN